MRTVTLIPVLGMVVRPHGNLVKRPSEWEGVIVGIDQPHDENHGCVVVWLKHKLNYGDNNCEHYAFYSHEQLATILKQVN